MKRRKTFLALVPLLFFTLLTSTFHVQGAEKHENEMNSYRENMETPPETALYTSAEIDNVDTALTPRAQVMKRESEKLTIPQIKTLLREVAVEKGIPAEILKAIAYAETGWKQFDSDGQPIVSDDGGIGIMQITASDEELQQKNIDKERLLWDTRYNIEVGARWLLDKWNLSFLPKINNHEKDKIEDWYFAILAYNGLSKRNDPNITTNTPYQERVFELIRTRSSMVISATPRLDIRYTDPSRPDLMSFAKDDHYVWGTNNQTTQNYEIGDMVYTNNPFLDYSRLRDGVDGNEMKKLSHYNPLQVISGPFEPMKNIDNHFVWYEVKGNGFTGYIASSNVLRGDVKLFTDVTRDEVASAVGYLQLKNIITGYEDGTFRPNQGLLRHHAARLMVKALDLKLPEGYKMKATDMKPGDVGYGDMLIAEAYGLMKGENGRLMPNDSLSRSQMATILVRAFGDYFESPNKNYSFDDIGPDFWNYEPINVLAHNGITISDSYHPYRTVTRSQFALFLNRTLALVEKQK